MTELDGYAPFWDHIEALRCTLMRMLVVIVLGTVISFFFYHSIISFLTSPLTNPLATVSTQAKIKSPYLVEEQLNYFRTINRGDTPVTYHASNDSTVMMLSSPDIEKISETTFHIPPGAWLDYAKPIPPSSPLIVLGPIEGIAIALKTSLWVGLVGTSPVWLFSLLQFIAPALQGHEKRLILPFLMISGVFIVLGALFAFTITIPIANQYLSSFNQAIGTNMWSLNHYLDYTLFLLLANSLAFEFCVIGLFAVHLGMLTADTLRSHRRLAIVCAFIIGALLTPPDVLTQLMLAIPLILLYEAVIAFACLHRLRNTKRND